MITNEFVSSESRFVDLAAWDACVRPACSVGCRHNCTTEFRERCTVRQVNLTLSLAFLAPELVKAAVEGRLPRGFTLERLRDPHVEWSRQFQDLGLNPN